MKEFEALAAAASVLLPRLRDRGINVNEGMGVGGAGGRGNAVQWEGGRVLLPPEVNWNHCRLVVKTQGSINAGVKMNRGVRGVIDLQATCYCTTWILCYHSSKTVRLCFNSTANISPSAS